MRFIKEMELGGRNMTMKLTNEGIATAEKHLGRSIMAVLQEGMGVEATHVLAWVAMRTFDRKLKLKEVYVMVDQEMEEDRAAYRKLMEAVLELVVDALGLADEEEIEGNA